jgi:hypothetical protein
MKVTNKNRRRKRIRKLEPVGSRKLKKNEEDGRTGRPRRGNSNRVQLYLHLKDKKP